MPNKLTDAVDYESNFDPRLLAWCRYISLGISIALVLGASIFFISWFQKENFYRDIPLAQSFQPSVITAFALLMIGLSLFFLHNEKTKSIGKWIGFSLIVCSIFFFLDNYYDLLLMQNLYLSIGQSHIVNNSVVTMPYLSCFTVFCFGVGLFLQPNPNPTVHQVVTLISLLIGGISLILLYTYAFDLLQQFQFKFHFIPRYTTALLLGLAAIALLLLRPTEGLASIITNNTLGGYTVRRLLLVPFITPFLTSFLRSIGEYFFHFPSSLLFAAGTFINMTILSSVIMWYGRSLWILDLKKRDFLNKQIKLNARIAELTRAETELEQSKLFAFTCTHDLQEPIHKILLYKNLMKNDLEKNNFDLVRQHFDTLEKTTHQLSELIHSVHDYASILIQNMAFEKVDLNTILETAKTQLLPLIEKSKASINFEKLPHVFGDAILLEHLFYHIIKNSLIFYKEGVPPIVTISSEIRDGKASITFSDNGLGIAQEHISKLFQLFYRINQKSVYPGKGLGLPACKRIVQRHEGTIEITSVLGEGTDVIITLPLQPPQI